MLCICFVVWWLWFLFCFFLFRFCFRFLFFSLDWLLVFFVFTLLYIAGKLSSRETAGITSVLEAVLKHYCMQPLCTVRMCVMLEASTLNGGRPMSNLLIKSWSSSDYPARHLAVWGRYWDWFAWCWFTVTGLFDL